MISIASNQQPVMMWSMQLVSTAVLVFFLALSWMVAWQVCMCACAVYNYWDMAGLCVANHGLSLCTLRRPGDWPSSQQYGLPVLSNTSVM